MCMSFRLKTEDSGEEEVDSGDQKNSLPNFENREKRVFLIKFKLLNHEILMS